MLIRTGLLILILFVLAIFFWQDIAATGFVYTARELNNERTYLENTPQPYTLVPGQYSIESTIQLRGITIPTSFIQQYSSSSENFAVVRENKEGGGKYLLTFTGQGLANYFLNDPETDREACTILSVGDNENICNSNFLFYKKMLETTTDDLGWFSSRENKVVYSVIYILKSVIMVPGTIEEFETDTIKGFRINQENDKSIAIIFADNKQYEITTNVSKEEFDFILNNIEIVPG